MKMRISLCELYVSHIMNKMFITFWNIFLTYVTMANELIEPVTGICLVINGKKKKKKGF